MKKLNEITDFQTDSQKLITDLYNACKPKFTGFIHHSFPVIDKTTIMEIYHDSFLEMYNDVRAGRLTELTSSVDTYLCGIGKKMALKHLRKRRNLRETEFIDDLPDEIEDVFEEEEWNRIQEIALQLLSAMDAYCKEILTLYYLQQKNMREIAVAMNYKNEDSAKSRKSSCMEKIKTAFRLKLKREGLITK